MTLRYFVLRFVLFHDYRDQIKEGYLTTVIGSQSTQSCLYLERSDSSLGGFFQGRPSAYVLGSHPSPSSRSSPFHKVTSSLFCQKLRGERGDDSAKTTKSPWTLSRDDFRRLFLRRFTSWARSLRRQTFSYRPVAPDLVSVLSKVPDVP